jgi:CP family cyanate transporter-like MFS transporter
LDDIQKTYGLSLATAGFLTTIILIACGAFSPAISTLIKRVSLDKTVIYGLAALVIGELLRAAPSFAFVCVGSAFVGFGMIAGYICLPLIIIRNFSKNINGMNMYFATVMNAVSFFATIMAARIAAIFSWQINMYIWALIAIVTLIYWVLIYRNYMPSDDKGDESKETEKELLHSKIASDMQSIKKDVEVGWKAEKSILKQPVAWVFVLIFASNATLYFSFTAMLPKMLTGVTGVSNDTAAFQSGLFQATAIIGSLLIGALLASSLKEPGTALCLAAGYLVLTLGFVFFPHLAIVWVLVGGSTQGASYVLCFTLIAKVSKTPEHAKQISAFAQMFGYIIAAFAPTLIGSVAETSWTVSFIILAGVAVVYLFSMFSVAKGVRKPPL